MSDQQSRSESSGRQVEQARRQGDPSALGSAPPTEIFAPPPVRSSGMPLSAWLIAGAVILAVVGALLLAGNRRTPAISGVQPADAYASNLELSQLQMSESTSLSGGKSTFIDGHIRNSGSSTVTGVTVQVLFRNEEQMPPGSRRFHWPSFAPVNLMSIPSLSVRLR